MDVYNSDWNSCLLSANKQLTRQLEIYKSISSLVGGSSSSILAISQLLMLRQHPTYGIIKDQMEWQHLFTIIDLFYGSCLATHLALFQLSTHELKLCYLIRARLNNKTIAILFNISPPSVLKAKQRIKSKLSLSSMEYLNEYLQRI